MKKTIEFSEEFKNEIRFNAIGPRLDIYIGNIPSVKFAELLQKVRDKCREYAKSFALANKDNPAYERLPNNSGTFGKTNITWSNPATITTTGGNISGGSNISNVASCSESFTNNAIFTSSGSASVNLPMIQEAINRCKIGLY
jgi:hypothetical protein